MKKIQACKREYNFTNIDESVFHEALRNCIFSVPMACRSIQHKIGDLVDQRSVVKPKEGEEINCNICWFELDKDTARHFGCGHYFCDECMVDYINYKISTGPSALESCCPFEGCPFRITIRVVEKVCDDKTFKM